MSFYRSVLAAVAALAIASPVLADDTVTTTNSTTTSDGSTTIQTVDTDTTTTSSKINLNTASASELMKVKGLNASKAKAIVAYRKKHGSFKSTADITLVKGFKKLSTEALQSIQDQLTVE